MLIFAISGIVYASSNLQEVLPGEKLTAEKWNELVGQLKALTIEVETLKNNDSGLDLTIPSGAVIPFNLSSCPTGWSKFTELKDKFIIGAGNSYTLGNTGGSSTTSGTIQGTILTVNQMPVHNHSGIIPSGTLRVVTGNVSSGNGNYEPTYNNAVSSTKSSTSGNAGGGQAHTHTFNGGSNLPPFIALTFCVKD